MKTEKGESGAMQGPELNRCCRRWSAGRSHLSPSGPFAIELSELPQFRAVTIGSALRCRHLR